jgi:hypothetical protein
MATVTVGGLPYELLNPDDLDFGQQRRLKRYSGGMGIAEIVRGLQGGAMDPDAWFALILLSVQEKNPTFSEADLEKLNMVEIVMSGQDDPEDEVDVVPPAEAPAAASGPARRSRSASGSAATPATSGAPA